MPVFARARSHCAIVSLVLLALASCGRLPSLPSLPLLPPGPRMDHDIPIDGWIRVRSPRFDLLSGADRSRSMALAQNLEVFAAVVATTSNIDSFEPKVPARIFLFPDERAFSHFRFASWVAGQMRATPRGLFIAMSLDLSNSREALFHEYTHYLQANQGSMYYPVWYREGFAEFLSGTRIRAHLVTLGGVPDGSIQTLDGAPELVPVEELFGARSYGDAEDLSLFYAQSWLLVHFFHAAPQLGFPHRLEEMMRFLAESQSSASPADAYRASFSASPAELDRELSDYWKLARSRGSFPGLQIDTRKLHIPPIAPPTEVVPDAIATELGFLFLDDGPRGARLAERMFERALARAPRNSGALAGLARALIQAGDLDGAEAALERARSENPESTSIHMADGELAMARARQLDPSSADAVDLRREARAAFRRAIEADPRTPEAFISLGRSYLDSDEEVTLGIEALSQALRRIGSDADVELDLGRLYLRAGSGDSARTHFENVLRWSHGSSRDQARQLLAELDGGAGS